MQTYYCYIHTVGLLDPAMRRVEAMSEAELPDSLMAAMTRWPALEVIEMVDVYNLDDRRVFRLHAGPDLVTH